MAGGVRELSNPNDMSPTNKIVNNDLIPALRDTGVPVAIAGSAFADILTDSKKFRDEALAAASEVQGVVGPLYDTIALGLAATAVGDQFRVASSDPDVSSRRYKKTGASTYTLVETVPSVSALSAKANAAYLDTVLKYGSVIPLTDVAGTNNVTSKIDPAFVAAGVTTIPFLGMVTWQPASNNTTATPVMMVGGETLDIRDGSGDELPAGYLDNKRNYVAIRRGTQLRVLFGAEVATTSQLAAISADQQKGRVYYLGGAVNPSGANIPSWVNEVITCHFASNLTRAWRRDSAPEDGLETDDRVKDFNSTWWTRVRDSAIIIETNDRKADTNDIRNTRPQALVGVLNPQGHTSIDAGINVVMCIHNASNTFTFWKATSAPADGIATENLVPDAHPTAMRWWVRITNNFMADLEAALADAIAEQQSGREYYIGGAISPSGQEVPEWANSIKTSHFATNTSRSWRRAAPPADGLETDNLVKDAAGVWWQRFKDRAIVTEVDDRKSGDIEGIVRLFGATGDGATYTANLSGQLAGSNIANGHYLHWQCPVTNTVEGPLFSMPNASNTTTRRICDGSTGTPVAINALEAGVVYTLFISGPEKVLIVDRHTSLSEWKTINDKANLATSLGASMTALQVAMENVPRAVLQETAAMPVRPAGAKICQWYTWDNPAETGVMFPTDVWFKTATPTSPALPGTDEWGAFNFRNGTSLIILNPLPPQNPVITARYYRIDGGTPVSFNADEVTVSGLAAGTHTVEIRYENFKGQSLWSIPKSVVVNDLDFTDSFNETARQNTNVSDDPRWEDVAWGSSGRRAKIINSYVQTPGTNEHYTVRCTEYFTPNQFSQIRILSTSSLDNQDNRGVDLWVRMGEPDIAGVSQRYPNGYYLNITTGVWELWRSSNIGSSDGSYTSTKIYRQVHTLATPIKARIEAEGRDIRVILNDTLIYTYTDNTTLAVSSGSVGFAIESGGSEGATTVQVDDFVSGNIFGESV